MNGDNKSYAVLIDAENISADYAEKIIEEILKYGTPTIKRIYGDWSSNKTKKWESKILDLALTPRQQFAYTKGKNAVDMLLVIDALDILFANNHIGGVCIVSSDSDYIPLVNRLKESDIYMLGMGEEKTPKPFCNSCDKFIYLENLIDENFIDENNDENSDENNGHTQKKKLSKSPHKISKALIRLVGDIIDEFSDEDGKLHLAQLGTILNKRDPSFDTRSYGYKKLSTLLKSDIETKKYFEVRYDDESRSSYINNR